ncbi:MAG: hypothetical protein GAK43_01794 [Stenotrophomonas maltophilia]|nr:MAG: hypothetical protein GAK43_01794 [Stenotrophomonas maltophilia]
MSSTMYLLMAFLMLCAAALVLLAQSRNTSREQRLIEERLGATSQRPRDSRLGMSRWGVLRGTAMGRRLHLRDQEVNRLLDQAGWNSHRARAIYQSVMVGGPIAGALLAVIYGFARGHGLMQFFVPLLFGAGIGFLIPKRVLGYFAKRRCLHLAEEVIVFIQMIRILFDSGLTVEQTLRVVHREGRHIVPVLADELTPVLAHADSGLDLADELDQMSRRMGVSELNDSCNVLRQMLRQGGSARASLLTLKTLFEDRRLTALQEKVSKLSAKMSLVMMLLLFPALLIVLAGPGFIAITKALGGMGS